MRSLLTVFAVLGLILAASGAAEAVTTWYVDPGPGTPVQDAITGAGVGDTVHLNAGTYREWLTIDKSIILEGAGAGSTTLRGWSRYQNQQEYNDHRSDLNYWTTGWYGVVTVNANDVEIRNMRIEEASTWGIHADGVQGLKIHDNKFDWLGQSSIRVLDVDGAQIYNNEAFRSTRQTWYDPFGTVPGSLVDSTRGGDLVEVWGTTGAATEINNNATHDGNLPLYIQGGDALNVHDNTFDVRAPTEHSMYNFGFVDTTGMYLSGADNSTFDNNTVTGEGYLAARLFSTCDNSTLTNNTFNSPVRDEGSAGTTWAISNTWNDGHQHIAATSGQWWKKGSAVIMTQPVSAGNSPVATNLAVTAMDPTQDPGAGHDWFGTGETGDLIGDVIEVTSVFSDHTFEALIKFYYDASEVSAAGQVPSHLTVMWWDEGTGEWKLPNADFGGSTYSGGWRGNLLPDLADDLLLGDYGYYDDASYEFAWAYVDHYTDFGMTPEPATLALMGLGGLATLIRRRRR